MPQYRNYHDVKAPGVAPTLIGGSFVTDGAGAITASVGVGFTATKPGATTGIYRITLVNPFFSIICAVATVYNAGTALASTIQVKAKTASTGVIDFHYLLEGGGALAAADLASGGVDFIIWVKDSSAPK